MRPRTASRIKRVTWSPNSHGSRRLVSICAWARKKGWKAPSWYQRTSSSESGLPLLDETNQRSRQHQRHRREYRKWKWREAWGSMPSDGPTKRYCRLSIRHRTAEYLQKRHATVQKDGRCCLICVVTLGMLHHA